MNEDFAERALKQVAKERHELRVRSDGTTLNSFTDDYTECWLAGEYAFAREFGLPLDLELRPNGDGGRDFEVPLIFRVDVKCAKKPFNLLVRVGKVTSDIYVLAHYSGDILRAKLLGWEMAAAVRAAPTGTFGYKVENHYIPAGELRPMAELKARMAGIKHSLAVIVSRETGAP